MWIVLVPVGEDLRVSEVWRHSRRGSRDRRGEPFPFPSSPWAGARLLLNARESYETLGGLAVRRRRATGPVRGAAALLGFSGRGVGSMTVTSSPKPCSLLVTAKILPGARNTKRAARSDQPLSASRRASERGDPHQGRRSFIEPPARRLLTPFGDQGAELLVWDLGGAQREFVTGRVTGGFVEQGHDFEQPD
jgi:hypothetical protein